MERPFCREQMGCDKMKIGIALSGCDWSGLAAYHLLGQMQESGVRISAVSSCCVPSLTALLWAAGAEYAAIHRRAQQFLAKVLRREVDEALTAFCDASPLAAGQFVLPIALNAVNIPDGKRVVFTNTGLRNNENLTTFELDNARDSCRAALSLADGLASYHYRDCRLCDYAVWHGIPCRALRQMGADKIVSVSFEPKYPRTPYEVLVKQTVRKSSRAADIHIPIEVAGSRQSMEEYAAICDNVLARTLKKIIRKTRR